MKLVIFNESGSPRWRLIIKKVEGSEVFGVFEEDERYSLFNHHEKFGLNREGYDTPGKALDAFLGIEKSLIDSLG